MSIEWQVCSFDLSKKLEELGVKQGSYFYWAKNEVYDIWEVVHFERHWESHYSAFTVAELGMMLISNLCINGEHPNCFIAKGTQEMDKWTVGYSTMKRAVTPFYTETNEADARAKILIYLIEKGHIKC